MEPLEPPTRSVKIELVYRATRMVKIAIVIVVMATAVVMIEIVRVLSR